MIGFISGTFDMLHSNHRALLKDCRDKCDRLIVGLVTDSVTRKQKREPIMSYHERCDALIHTSFVDHVVPFANEDRRAIQNDHNVDVFFTTNEYENAEEFKNVRDKLIVIARRDGVSTSHILAKHDNSVASQMTVVSLSIGGSIMSDNHGHIFKTIRLSNHEIDNTRDVFGLYEHPSNGRNWAESAQLPFVSGANGNREIVFYEAFGQERWCPVIAINMSETLNHVEQHHVDINDEKDMHALCQKVTRSRVWPAKIATVVMTNGGITLADWIRHNKEDERLETIIEQVNSVIKQIQAKGWIHGDIHCRNVVVDANDQISLLDAGWAQSMNFEMSKIERRELVDRIDTDFDYKFFQTSLLAELEKIKT
jgi:cytidyltransferase-like protein